MHGWSQTTFHIHGSNYKFSLLCCLYCVRSPLEFCNQAVTITRVTHSIIVLLMTTQQHEPEAIIISSYYRAYTDAQSDMNVTSSSNSAITRLYRQRLQCVVGKLNKYSAVEYGANRTVCRLFNVTSASVVGLMLNVTSATDRIASCSCKAIYREGAQGGILIV